MDLPADRGPRGCRDRDDRDAPLAGTPGTQARVRRRVRSERGTGRIPHRHRSAHSPHRVPGGPPRCQRAPGRERLGRVAQRGHRGGGHRRGGRGRVHRTARSVERTKRRGIGTGLGLGGASTRAGIDRPGDSRHGWRGRQDRTRCRPAPRAPLRRPAPDRLRRPPGAARSAVAPPAAAAVARADPVEAALRSSAAFFRGAARLRARAVPRVVSATGSTRLREA